MKAIKVAGGKISDLDITYPDNYQMLLVHENGTTGTLSVDIVCRKAVRNLEIYGENLYISWDGSPTGLEIYDIEKKQPENVDLYSEIDHQEGYSAFVVENAYKNELISFFSQVQNQIKPIYTFSDDKKTLDIIDYIESQVSNG